MPENLLLLCQLSKTGPQWQLEISVAVLPDSTGKWKPGMPEFQKPLLADSSLLDLTRTPELAGTERYAALPLN
jgi:hypothetical protein